MNFIFKLVVWTIMINSAIGIMNLTLGDVWTNTCYSYNSTYSSTNQFNASVGGVINPNNNLQDQTSSFIRLIDSLNLGVIGKFLSGINAFFFGSIDFLQCLLNNQIPGALVVILKGLISSMYIFGAIYLWTGRVINH